MKRFILFSALLFAVFSVPAQQPDAGQVIVHYKFIH